MVYNISKHLNENYSIEKLKKKRIRVTNENLLEVFCIIYLIIVSGFGSFGVRVTNYPGDSNFLLYADDFKLYRDIMTKENGNRLQKDLNGLVV